MEAPKFDSPPSQETAEGFKTLADVFPEAALVLKGAYEKIRLLRDADPIGFDIEQAERKLREIGETRLTAIFNLMSKSADNTVGAGMIVTLGTLGAYAGSQAFIKDTPFAAEGVAIAGVSAAMIAWEVKDIYEALQKVIGEHDAAKLELDLLQEIKAQGYTYE